MTLLTLPSPIPTSSVTNGIGQITVSVYGGFDPGTFQPWALNLTQSALGGAGIARGMQVTTTTPAAMTVLVNIDTIAGDGVCFLGNGCWLRIDASTTLSVPANSSGNTRTDAVVAQVDPTGSSPVALSYITGWTTGFKGQGYGTPSRPENQLVLALVSVPNGASSIVASNITMTPLRASVGGLGPTARGSIVADSSGSTSQAGVFTAFNVVLTTGALNGQTTFTVPLAPRQRLVPMGKIGGATEVGFFAGQSGWYVPRLTGSVSGTLTVSSLDYVGGTITSSVAVQAGETVTAAFKYYDFGNDASGWGNVLFLERDSPYIVYQGDAIPGTVHITDDVWDGLRNGVVLNTGDTFICTFIGSAIAPHLKSAASTTISRTNAGVSMGSFTLDYAVDVAPYATGRMDTFASGDLAIQQYAVTVTAGQTEFGGAHITMAPTYVSYFFDGGEVIIGGFPVYVGSTSVNLSALVDANGATGVIYADRYGTVTASMAAQALGEMANGTIPVAKALGFGGTTNNSSWYGSYALPHQPAAYRPSIILGGGSHATKGSQGPHGWQVTADPTSPYGAYVTSTSVNDILAIVAPGSGIDVTCLAPTAVPITVFVQGITSYTTVVPTSSNHRVHMTLCSSLPPQTLFVQLEAKTSNSQLSIEDVTLRIPAVPSVPDNALSLAYVYLASGSTVRSYSFLRSQLEVTELAAGQTGIITSPTNGAPGAGLWMANTTTGASVKARVASYTAASISFLGSQQTGIATIMVDGHTASFDTYNPSGAGVVTTAWYTTSGGINSYTVYSTGTKNASSTGTDLYPLCVNTLEYPLVVIDTRQQPVDGVHPSIAGSALLGQQGEVVGDATFGIAPAHLRDRAASSRKMAPTTAVVVATTAYSGFTSSSHLDPFCVTSITVEVPSMLLIGVAASPSIIGGSGASAQAAVDGSAVGGSAVTNGGASENRSLSVVTQAVVGPGTHTVQLWMNAFASSAQPYFDNNEPRSLSVVAFAL